jgi:hypothetical protein
MEVNISKSLVGNLGMFEVALRLTKMGKRITPHGGSCAFDLTDEAGNRYEVKTATASMKGDKDHYQYRGWVFASGSKNRNIAKFEYTAYVLLSESQEVERILLIPREEDRFRNGRTAIMKDTAHQRKTSPRSDLVDSKWYDKYVL